MVVGDAIYVMLLTESYFTTFTQKQMSNAHENTEVLITLDADSRDEVQ